MAIRSRKGSAGDDVTSTEQFVEDVVVADEDQSYEVEGTDSPEETVQEATVITDNHEVVNPTEDGEIAEEEIEESREGRRGSRKGYGEEEDVEEVIMNEDGDTQEVELPEPDEEELEEREGRRGRRTRRGVRRGLRKGLTYGELRDMLPTNGDADEEDRIFKEVGFDENTEEADVFFRALEGDPGSSYIFEETIGRSGGRKGSRRGIAYGGKSEVHQESIKAAVSVAMRDRRL